MVQICGDPLVIKRLTEGKNIYLTQVPITIACYVFMWLHLISLMWQGKYKIGLLIEYNYNQKDCKSIKNSVHLPLQKHSN